MNTTTQNNHIGILVSFIIPVYNVRLYLKQCLDSIYNSGKDNLFEVICIDDCSEDESADICLIYESEHSNFHIIRNHKNLGLSVTRNIGVNYSKGKYIWFVDSDDMVISECVENLFDIIQNRNIDVLAFNYCDMDVYGNVIKSPDVFTDTRIMSGAEFVNVIFGSSFVNHLGYSWRFLLKKDFLTNYSICFPEGVLFEDTVWTAKVLIEAKSIMGCSKFGYLYRHHDSSIMGKFAYIPSAKQLYDYCISTGLQLLLYADSLRHKGGMYIEFSNTLKCCAVNNHVNTLPIYLARTRREQRFAFYDMFKHCRVERIVYKSSNCLTKSILVWPFSIMVGEALTIGYKILKRRNKE